MALEAWAAQQAAVITEQAVAAAGSLAGAPRQRS
jgi:hypothetical protein